MKENVFFVPEKSVVGALKWWQSRTNPSMFKYFNYFLICFLLFYYILTLFLLVWLPPVSCKATFSSLSALETAPERCPCPPGPPLPPLITAASPPMKKSWCLRLISPGWISDSSPLFFCLCFVFSLSLSVSVSCWWGEWSWSGGWGLEEGGVRLLHELEWQD